jgi:hypothetical protein
LIDLRLFWILVLLKLWVISIRLAIIIIILIRLITVLIRISSLWSVVSTHDLKFLKESNRIHSHISTTIPAIFSYNTEIDRIHHLILWLNLSRRIDFARFNNRRSKASLLVPKSIITSRVSSHIHHIILVPASWYLLFSHLFLEKSQKLDLNLVFESFQSNLRSLRLFHLLDQTIQLLVLLLNLSLNLLNVITSLLDLLKFFFDCLLVKVREGQHDAHVGLSQFLEHVSQDGIESGTS